MTEIQFEELMDAVLRLTPIERVRLVERVVSTLEDVLADRDKLPKRSLLGLWADLGTAPSETDINEARQEMWGNFPREDIG